MKTIVLDRDGVINEDSDAYIKSPEEWTPVPGSLEAIALLTKHGFTVTVATNQSGIARGLFDGVALAAIHHKMCSMVEKAGGFIDGVFFCPHGPNDGCNCRKPATGLLQQIEVEFQCVLPGAYMVGDSLKDVQAAQTYGMQAVLVRTGKGAQSEALLETNKLEDVPVYDDLLAATKQLLLSGHD